MNEERFDRRKNNQTNNNYVCSICLNRKPSRDDKNIECYKRKSKSCPICQKSLNYENNFANQNSNNNEDNDEKPIALQEQQLKCGKNIQTSQTDVPRDMSLLNEVLTVFQTKKQYEIPRKKCKTIILKDASVNTEDIKRDVSKLTITNVLQFTIEANNQMPNNKFQVISSQPETTKTSQFSLDLMNRKSSSIPQMKLEELKKSLKEKTKSKDAIEEVNRMFATVRKCDINEKVEIPNRPMVRSGPRVLPVVKTPNENTETNLKSENKCRYCQTNYKMSSGDSFECCHRKNDRCEECFYMMCCHYQHRMKSGAICPNCCKDCEHNKDTNTHV